MAVGTNYSTARSAFVHDALFYDGLDDFVEHVGQFVSAGLERDDAVLVATDQPKAEALRDSLGSVSRDVAFVDIVVEGLNPARIIPIWREVLESAGASGRSVTGVGEPIWSGRTGAALLESERHETLLNLAFADSEPWSLLCPYDVATLPPAVIEEALRNHPGVHEPTGRRASSHNLDPRRSHDQLAELLPEPDGAVVRTIHFAGDVISDVRDEVVRYARHAGLRRARIEDVALAVHELVTNSVRHGGGSGTLRMWQEGGRLVLEVSDRGALSDPLAGRRRPDRTLEGGRGLWLVNRLCDLVQIRSTPEGTRVRVHMHVDD